MNKKKRGFALYLEPRILAILFLGFSAGLPLMLTFSTLSAWLTEAGVSRTQIGLFSMVGLPYSFKFLWSPLVDHLRLPLIGRWLGRRRSWAITAQLALIAAIFGLGMSAPGEAPLVTAAFAVAVAFLSATQDIVVDALRVELLPAEEQGAAAAMAVLGYRIGMLVAGAGALFLAELMQWSWVYAAMAGMMIVGILTVLLLPEPAPPESEEDEGERRSVREWFNTVIAAAFVDFAKRKKWWLLLILIALFKVGDSLVGVMAMPFYLDVGFSKAEIASVSKIFGFVATIVGGLVGGVLVNRLGLFAVLLYTGLFQMISNLLFAAQATVGSHLGMLTVTIAIENVASGMGTAAFVAFLSALCSARFTATQYALLSSLAALGRTFLASPGGWLADQIDWVAFFVVSTLIAIPGLLVLLTLKETLRDLDAALEAAPEKGQ